MILSGKKIYFLRPTGEKGPIKIGSSVRPESRLITYQIWSPVILELVAFLPVHHTTETFLHRHFIKWWLHGEWFSWNEELQGLLDYIVRHGEMPDWVTPPTNWQEYQDFLQKYPIGKTRGRRGMIAFEERAA